MLPEFNRRYPNVSVQIHEMCTREYFITGFWSWRLDFAVVSCDHIPQGFTYDHLMTEHLVLVAPMDDRFAKNCCYYKNGKAYVDIKKV